MFFDKKLGIIIIIGNCLKYAFKIFISLSTFFLFSKAVSAGWFDNLFGSSYSYNVLLYTPSNKEIFVGNTKTISDCQVMAFREADYRKIPSDYLCCKTDGKSFCISKHR